MERERLRIPVSMFQSGSSTTNLYKIIKDPYNNFASYQNQNNNIFGRHVVDESNHKWSGDGQRH